MKKKMFSKADQLLDTFPNESPPFAVSTIFAVDFEKYETMILYTDPTELYLTRYVLAKRYETMEEAEKGHEAVIKNLLAGKKYSGKDELCEKMTAPEILEATEKIIIGQAIKGMIKKK